MTNPGPQDAHAAQEKLLHLVHSEFERRKLKNQAYSLRAFARALGIQVSALSDILNGKRGITRRTGARILARVAVQDGSGPQLYAKLRNRNSRGTDGLPAAAARPFSTVVHEEFRMLAEWQHFAILSLADTDDFRGEPAWVARRLGIASKKARESLELLAGAGMLKKNAKGKLGPTGKRFAMTTEVADLAVQRSHFDALERASDALGAVPVGERDFSLINLAISPERLPEARAMLQSFRRRFSESLEKRGDRREVYRLSMQFFPLTEIQK